MIVTTEGSVRALSLNSEQVMLGELNLIKHELERVFESDNTQVPKEELSNDMLRFVSISERIKQTEVLREKFDIYSEYRSLLDELKSKYSDFLTPSIFEELETDSQYIDGLKELIMAQSMMLFAFEDETDKVRQHGLLYTGIVRLSEVVEEFLPYFSQGLIEGIKNIASALLKDPTLKPDRTTQDESIFSYLTGLKNTARAVLWQIAEYQVENEGLHLSNSSIENSDLDRQMQMTKNQAAMGWARSRLEQIESIRTVKG